MMRNLILIVMVLAFTGEPPGNTGRIVSHPGFPSRYVPARNVDVWLPPSYDADAGRHFPVIYIHDGQNLFEDTLAGFGVEWGVDEAVTRLSAEGTIPECIVVGIWNTPDRYPEYQPQRPYKDLEPEYRSKVTELYGGEPVSDLYLQFLVDELKPFIDSAFRTLPEREATLIMGSSMGGLISVYALCEYPDVFAGAGCLSTHWVTRVDLEDPEMARVMERYLIGNLPPAGRHSIYFDYGTEGLDAWYEPHQKRIDSVMAMKGYTRGKDWKTLKFEGADHNERSWRERLGIPLEFLAGHMNR